VKNYCPFFFKCLTIVKRFAKEEILTFDHKIISMFKYFLFLLLFTLSVKSYSANIIFFGEPKANEVFYSLPGMEMRLSLADYIKMKPSDFKKITGHKLTLKETIVFKITQKRIKKTIEKTTPLIC
jgi:hypothetical protein